MEILKVTTESGSVYFVDEQNKRLRRESSNNRTVRATEEWRSYASIDGMKLGYQMFIIWTNETPLLDETVKLEETLKEAGLSPMPATETSPVVSIERVHV